MPHPMHILGEHTTFRQTGNEPDHERTLGYPQKKGATPVNNYSPQGFGASLPSPISSDWQAVTAMVREHHIDTQVEIRRLRAVVRKLYRKMEERDMMRASDNPELESQEEAETQIQIIRHLRENLEKFNATSDHLIQIHADMKEWRSVSDELRQFRETVIDWKDRVARTSLLNHREHSTPILQPLTQEDFRNPSLTDTNHS